MLVISGTVDLGQAQDGRREARSLPHDVFDAYFIVVVRVLEVETVVSPIGIKMFSERRVLIEWNAVRGMGALPAPSVVIPVHVAAAECHEPIGQPPEYVDCLTGLGFRVGNHVENNVRGKRLKHVLMFGQVISIPTNLPNRVQDVGFGLSSVKDDNLMSHSDEALDDMRTEKARGSDSKNFHGSSSGL
jgi:hypothetical protein